MRILMISDVYFPRINGVSTSIQTFRTEMLKLGHDVHLIAPAYEEAFEDDETTLRITSKAVPFDPEDRMMTLSAITAMTSKLEAFEFDIIHIHTPFIAHYAGLKLSKRLGIPCIVTYHTLFEEYFYHYIPWLPKAFLKLVARHFSTSQCNQVAGVISPSSLIIDLLQRYGVTNSMTVLPTGIDADKFKNGNPLQFKKKFSIPQNKKILLNVSRIAFEKNIGLLISVFSQLLKFHNDIHLVIAGEGPAKKAYTDQVRELGIVDNVTFVGYLDRASELVDCYHAADIFIFASKTETQGLVLLESMAASTPVVSIAEMGTKDVLIEGKGVLITDGTLDDFSAKVSHLLNSPTLYKELVSSGVDYAAEWDSSSLAKDMLSFYSTICEQQDKVLLAETR